MIEGYTTQISDLMLDLPDGDIAEIWADIESTPSDTTADKWKKKLQKIAYDYSFSSRFALMRLISHRAGMKEGDPGFEARIGEETVFFADISLPHAQTLTPEENRQYIDLMMALADRQADSDPEVNRQTIRRGWLDQDSANDLDELLIPDQIRADEKKLEKARKTFRKENKKLYKTRITREEALQLGHILDFTLQQMQWFLLRVLDTEDGFRFNRSGDLIEAYGFLTGASWQHVEQLKIRYEEFAASIPKADDADRSNRWTQNAASGLLDMVGQWKYYPDEMDSRFLEWMKAQAPGLDLPSRTAGRIYRNLAAFACDLIEGAAEVPDGDDFCFSVQDICMEPGESAAALRLFYEDGKLSQLRCKQLADKLLLENKIQSASIQADNAKAWHVLTTRADGSLSTAGGMVNSSRTRVRDILLGTVQAEKGDLLYLLWFTANLIWQNEETPDEDALCCRMLNYLDAARELLDAALLPEFYPPHIMEQSMLLSIAMGGEEDSSVLYEYIMHILTATREREQGSRKHTEEERIRIVCFYLSDEHSMTLEECAAHFEISPKTLSAWVKDFRDQKII